MNGCVYRTEDNKCKFWSDYGKGIVSYCDPCDCEEKTVTNADRIRQMTDEELANWMATKTSCTRCPVDLDACHNFEFSGEMSCEEILLSWLKRPVEEVEK